MSSNQPLEPRRVAFSDLKHWLIEALDLFKRRSITFIFWHCLFVLTSVFLIGVIPWLNELVGVISTALYITITMAFAAAADKSVRPALPTVIHSLKNGIYAILLIAVFSLMIYAIVDFISAHIETVFPPPEPPTGEIKWWNAIFILSSYYFVLYLGGCLWLSQIFLIPLCSLIETDIRYGVKLAFRGFMLNLIVCVPLLFGILMTIFLLLLLLPDFLFLLLFGLPYFCIVLYVGFRHIYLGQRDNAPAVVRQPVHASASALS